MRTSLVILVGLLIVQPTNALGAQGSDDCYELEVNGGQWMATSRDPEPAGPFDELTPLLQIPARFLVSDSLGRFGGKTTRSIGDAASVFPRSHWEVRGDSLRVSWGTGFVGWTGNFARDAEGDRWRGNLHRFSDDLMGEPRGWWRYDASIRRISCPS